MPCSHCGGFIWAPDPEREPFCANCGRSVTPPATEQTLKDAGIATGKYVPHDGDLIGVHRRGIEYSPAPFHPPGRYSSGGRYAR